MDSSAHERFREIELFPASEVPEGGMKPALVEGEEIVVFNLDGGFYALCDLCPHGSFRFSRGVVIGDAVMCPGHRWTFDVRTGRCRTTEWEPAVSYRVRVREDGMVVVALPVRE